MAEPSVIGIGKTRIEALADGVFAIAMTLLVLELKVPLLPPDQVEDLPDRLFALWPKFVAFLVSFMVCGVYWVGHHAQLHYIRRSDRPFLWLNILFLFIISAIPFSAALIGEYPAQPLAIRVYCLNLIAAGAVLFGQLHYAAGEASLFDRDIDRTFVKIAGRRILMGPTVYLFAWTIAGFVPRAALALCGIAPLLYLRPGNVDQYWKRGHRTDTQSTSGR